MRRPAAPLAYDHRRQDRPAPHDSGDVSARGQPRVRLRLEGGAPTHPDWYHNLLAHPEVTVEIGEQIYHATAKPVTGTEHDQIYARWAEQYPQFCAYQEQTSRIIPVIELE